MHQTRDTRHPLQHVIGVKCGSMTNTRTIPEPYDKFKDLVKDEKKFLSC
jgi:hypothetical protein